MKKVISTVVTGLCLLLHGNAFAETGDIINFNFTALGASGTYSGIGVAGTGTQTWNTLYDTSGTQKINGQDNTGSNALYMSTGSESSGVHIEWTSAALTQSITTAFIGSEYEGLMNYFDNSNTQGSQITLTGLEEGTYTLYVYSQGCRNKNHHETLTLDANSITGSLASDCDNEDINNAFVTLTDIEVSSTGTLTIDYSTTTQIGIINAFQLEQTGVSGQDDPPVPEPASIILLGVGAAFARAMLSRKQLIPA